VVSSINASHKKIIQWAKDNNKEMAIVMEQDCFFPAKDGWEYFINNMPKVFDVYASSTYVDDLENKNHLCGFHCYIVHTKFYDTFLSVNDKGHIDTEIDNLKGDYKVCRPFAALQKPGWSFNNKAEVNYNAKLNKEDIYQ
jgi:hypothetical protein